MLYLDFPCGGRLRLRGTLIFPQNKYMALRLGGAGAGGGGAVCEDVFESMVVFGEAAWVGSKAENPEERELPMPAWLVLLPRATFFSRRRVHMLAVSLTTTMV